MYEYLAASSDSQFIYFTRLSQASGGVEAATAAATAAAAAADPGEEYYVPFFTDNFHTLLHEIANYFELPRGVADIRSLSVRAEGTECDGTFTELELGLDAISEEPMWEDAKRRLGEMGFGNKAPEGGMQMGEGVVVVVQL